GGATTSSVAHRPAAGRRSRRPETSALRKPARGVMALGCIGLAAGTRRKLRLDAMAFDDFDASRRHRPSDLLDRDPEDRGEFLGDGLAVPFARRDGDIPRRSGHDRGDWPAHDLAVAFDLDLADRDSDGQIMDVVPLPADDE